MVLLSIPTDGNSLSMCEFIPCTFLTKVKLSDPISGEYGMGAMANDLSLGCDCLGTIHYLVSIPSAAVSILSLCD